MIQTVNLKLQYGGRTLFEDVNLKFTKGNCYGVIGANGAGKSTFLKVLSGEIQPNKGDVVIDKGERMSVLGQNQNAFDAQTVRRTVLMGHKRLIEIMDEKDALYMKPDFSHEDGIKAGELEEEFTNINGWEAEAQAETLLAGLGIERELFDLPIGEIDTKVKVKVLLAQALFGNPDILILDEPTNNLDARSVRWLEEFLLDFKNIVIVVSHNRHFLNKVSTHICDVDYGQINIYMGNYDFWYESTQLIARQQKETNKKLEQRAKELQEFIARFSANASKSKQATSRKKELEKITLDDIKPSLRKYPYIDFKYEREIGNDILEVTDLTKKGYFENVSFIVKKGEKIAVISDSSTVITKFFDILSGEDTPDSGSFKWGKTILPTYYPQDNRRYFEGIGKTLVDWIGEYSQDKHETFLRSWLGRMLFSGDEALKEARVLSGGERARCMLARMMLQSGNFLTLDEPTNHLDLESITSLNKALVNFKGSLLLASSDYELMNTVTNRMIVINGTKTFDKEMNYDDYIASISE